MNKEDYIEIKEAEQLTGISAQYIYRLANKEEYKEYFKRIDRKKHVSKEFILNHFEATEKEDNDNNIVSKKIKPEERNYNDKVIEILEKQIEDLKNQMAYQEERAEKEIAFLREQIESKDRQLESKDKQLDQQQQLNAMTLSQMKELTAPKEEVKEEIKEEPIEKKKTWFERWLG